MEVYMFGSSRLNRKSLNRLPITAYGYRLIRILTYIRMNSCQTRLNDLTIYDLTSKMLPYGTKS